ncbi:hypothetical protein ccbrp13_35560 [Ktedonobacteria bacterium brp13]|nr:hypothetical protein ccbrp13_35560 [Ktedonobacteria bacterium brp13]
MNSLGTVFARSLRGSMVGCAKRCGGVDGKLLTLLSLVILLSCGCSIDGGKTSSVVQTSGSNVTNASFDPCTLFSKNDAAHILGSPIDVEPEIMAPLCRYAVKAKSGKNVKASQAVDANEILVSVGKSDNARSYFALDRTDAKTQSSVEDVKDIGDEAFTVSLDVGKAIVVGTGNTVYSIMIVYPHLATKSMQTDLLLLAKHAQQTVVAGVRTLPIPHPDPCGLLNTQDASQILESKPVSWFFTVNNAGVASCNYISSQGAGHRIQVISLTRPGVATSLYQNARMTVSSNNKLDLKGVGDLAFEDGSTAIWVLKGNTFMHISFLGALPTNGLITMYAKKAVASF